MDKSIEVAYQKLYRLTGGVWPRYIYVAADDEEYANDQPFRLEVIVDASLRPGRFYLTTKTSGPNRLLVDGRFRFTV